MPPAAKPAEPTRVALIEAALRLFGENGFEATSTRQIAQLAEANIAAISYHFGGKDKLRLACAEHVVGKIAATAILNIPVQDQLSREEAGQALEDLLAGVVQLLFLEPEGQILAQFLLREVAQPGQVMDTVLPKVLAPVHRSVCKLWEQATGQAAEAETVLLTVFSMLGQVVYFRVAEPLVRSRMGWDTIGEAEAAKILATVRRNLRVILADARERAVE